MFHQPLTNLNLSLIYTGIMASRGSNLLYLATGESIPISPEKNSAIFDILKESTEIMSNNNISNTTQLSTQRILNSSNSETIEPPAETIPSNISNTIDSSTQLLNSSSSNAIESDSLSEYDDSDRDPNYSSSSSSSSFSSQCSQCSSTDNEDYNHIVQTDATVLQSDASKSDNCNNSIDNSISIANSSTDDHSNATVISSEQETGSTSKNTKKRFRHESQWLKTKAKIMRSLGKEYVSSGKNKTIIPAKKIKEPCNEKCKFQCRHKINEVARQMIFSEFYNLSDINRKRDFISNCLQSVAPKYRYPRTNCRNLNNAFYFTIEGQKIRVCKHFFKTTLDINDRVISTVLKKRLQGGTVAEDRRGKHGSHQKVSDDVKNSVREHINSIPRIESHYLRKQSSKEFIEGGKTIAELHRDYERQRKAQGMQAANYHMYNDIFNSEYNISFFVPRKDMCNFCFKFNQSSNEEKEKLKLEFENHQKEKNLCRTEKINDKAKSSKTFIVCCYDMQAVMQIPKANSSIFYYKSKLNTMNLTISDIGQDETLCYVWHEGDGGKGSTEVCTCILLYLEYKSATTNSDDLEITLYSDNCGAQQKNR